MLNGMLDAMSRRLMRFSKLRSRANLYAWIEKALCEYGLDKLELVINIGAGGEVADLLDRAKLKPLAIDIDPDRRPNLVANIENLSALSDNSVDGVICIEVLEHVEHPHLAIQELYRVMKPGSILIGSTPFLLGLHDQPADYFRYTREGLKMLFADFMLLQLRERNTYFAAVSVLIVRRFVSGTPREKKIALLLSPILIPLAYLLELIDRTFQFMDGSTGYFFVFKKPGGKNANQP